MGMALVCEVVVKGARTAEEVKERERERERGKKPTAAVTRTGKRYTQACLLV